MNRLRSGFVVVGAALALAGCSPNPVRLTAYEALGSGLELIKADALVGQAARRNPVAAQALGLATVPPETEAFVRETISYHEAILAHLKGMELGTVDPDAPLPPGPTRDGVPR